MTRGVTGNIPHVGASSVHFDDKSKWHNQIMPRTERLTAIIEREDDGFISLCPELDVASQGASVEEARANLVEALTLFFATADPSEVSRRYRGDVLVTQVEVEVG